MRAVVGPLIQTPLAAAAISSMPCRPMKPGPGWLHVIFPVAGSMREMSPPYEPRTNTAPPKVVTAVLHHSIS